MLGLTIGVEQNCEIENLCTVKIMILSRYRYRPITVTVPLPSRYRYQVIVIHGDTTFIIVTPHYSTPSFTVPKRYLKDGVDDGLWITLTKDSNGIKYPKPSFLVPPQDLCFKSVGNESCQDLTLRTITIGQNNDYFQS